MRIFQQIDPPRRQARLRINQHASWYTWSEDFQSACKAWRNLSDGLEKPALINLRGGKEYYETFTHKLSAVADEESAREFRLFAEELYNLDVSDRLMLFTDMLDDSFCGRSLHHLFAYFRAAIVHITKDPMSAISQPLGRGVKAIRPFPLHSDLYIPQILFNIFEKVPDDSSGASLFLPVEAFKKLLPEVRSLPERERRKILHNILGLHKEDHYEEFFYLLHGYSNEWKDELERKMRSEQLRIKLYCGQGYLINDRKWLHGREAPQGGVPKRRFHRLIFNNHVAQKRSTPHCRGSML